MAGMVLGDVAAAATPATTTDRTKRRIASFMIGNPSGVRIENSDLSNHREMLEENAM
jgi:hypothetical protein